MCCFPPPELTLFNTVTYVVVGVVLREGKVLMMQEAKPSCRGRWYLPAGRMEAGETVEVCGSTLPLPQGVCPVRCVDAAILAGGGAEGGDGGDRTGVPAKECYLCGGPNPPLHCLGALHGHWCVVESIQAQTVPAAPLHGPGLPLPPACAGEVIGGALKTPERADGESLQAGWYSSDVAKLQREIPLRVPDILPLIELATAWKNRQAVGGAYHHLPLAVPHTLLSLSVLAVSRDQ